MMSVLSYIIDELLEQRERERQYQPWHRTGLFCNPLKSLFDQNFGLALLESELDNEPIHTHAAAVPLACGYVRPWRLCPEKDSGVCQVTLSKDGFNVNLDVQQFRPDEVSVKFVDGNIVVEGQHEEREDEHGFVTRSFKRHYLLPETIDPDSIQSSLSSDGVLQISAEPKVTTVTERMIPVILTTQPEVGNSGDGAKNL